jgi:hypothetical protein
LRDSFSNILVSLRLCGPPDYAIYLPKASNAADFMWKAPRPYKLYYILDSLCLQLHRYLSISFIYNSTIAKVATKLQAEESPKYNKVRIGLGAFHIESAAFEAFGKYIAESRGPHNHNETYILEKKSLNSF